MSILSNLLAFSCLAQVQQRQTRSASLGSRFLFEKETPKAKQNDQSRTDSKSLSKISLLSNSSLKIDPRKRSLHRIFHRLSMKARKYYYQVFVILETMKKNDQHIAQFYQQRKNRFEIGCEKMNQTCKIIFTKLYEQNWKQSCFRQIQLSAKYLKSLKMLSKSMNKIYTKIYFAKITTYLKNLQAIQLKIDILMGAISPINKIIQYQYSFFLQQIKTNIQINYEQDSHITKIDLSINHQESPTKNLKNIQQKRVTDEHLEIQTAYHCKKLKDNISIATLDKSYKDISKAYECYTELKQNPIELDPKKQKIPYIINKLLPQCQNAEEIGDLEDNSFIFRDMKRDRQTYNKNISRIQSLNTSDLAGESVLRIQGLIKDLDLGKKQKNKSQQELFHSDGINQYVNNLDQVNYLQKKKQANQSIFGYDAVSFKNSLVIERQSMQNIRQKPSFLKKKDHIRQKKISPSKYYPNSNSKQRQTVKPKSKMANQRFYEDYLIQQSKVNNTYNNDSCSQFLKSLYVPSKQRVSVPNLNISDKKPKSSSFQQRKIAIGNKIFATQLNNQYENHNRSSFDNVNHKKNDINEFYDYKNSNIFKHQPVRDVNPLSPQKNTIQSKNQDLMFHTPRSDRNTKKNISDKKFLFLTKK